MAAAKLSAMPIFPPPPKYPEILIPKTMKYRCTTLHVNEWLQSGEQTERLVSSGGLVHDGASRGVVEKRALGQGDVRRHPGDYNPAK